jgi:transcriptional regulator with XRE-family HTH domain
MDTRERPFRPSGLDLKLRRIAAGISQRELARRLDVSPQRVAAVEATYRPSEAMLGRYAAALSQGPSLDFQQIFGTRPSPAGSACGPNRAKSKTKRASQP